MPSNVRRFDNSCKTTVGIQNFYQCTTCDTSRQQYICETCKTNGNHRYHQIEAVHAYKSAEVKFCNCGDGTGLFHCSRHRKGRFPNGDVPLYLNHIALNTFNNNFGISPEIVKRLSRMNQIRFVPIESFDGRIVSKYFENTNAHQMTFSLCAIWSVYRKDQELNFRNKGYDRSRRLLLWHGTTRDNLGNILEKGLQTPTRSRNGLMFGSGVYFADRMSKSAQYSDKSGYGLLLLCEVAPGPMYETGSSMDRRRIPSHFKSIKGVGNKMPDRNEETRFDGIIVPSGKTVDYVPGRIKNCSLQYNEYVIFDSERFLIKFIVAFRHPYQSNNGCLIL